MYTCKISFAQAKILGPDGYYVRDLEDQGVLQEQQTEGGSLSD